MRNNHFSEDFILLCKILQFSEISRRISFVARGLCAHTGFSSWELIAEDSRTGSAHALVVAPVEDCSPVVVWAEGPLVPLEYSQVLQDEAIICWTLMYLKLHEENCFQENSKDFADYHPLLETGCPMQILALAGILSSAWKRNQFHWLAASVLMFELWEILSLMGGITQLSCYSFT
jgi:hypothetical protein